VDNVASSTPTGSDDQSGTFTISGVDSSDVVRVRTQIYAYGAGFDEATSEFQIDSGTVTSGYGPVSVGSPDFWGVYFTAS
jgi:hypothetical protein